MPIVRHGYAVRPNTDTAERARLRRIVRATATICGICHTRFQPGDNIEADHIIPVSAGGPDTLSNLRAVHRTCNRRRGQG